MQYDEVSLVLYGICHAKHLPEKRTGNQVRALSGLTDGVQVRDEKGS